jgi:magnesium chelatase family protein
MLARISSAAVMGVQSHPIMVEVDCAEGLPGFSMVGLPDSAVKEARDRVFSAMRNKGYRIPNRRITINLSPADIPKVGSSYDLPIALGLLMASEQVENTDVSDSLFVGELSLDGLVQPIRGILPIVLEAFRLGFKKVYVPRKNLQEVANVVDIRVFPITDGSRQL